jgi:CBS domain-containing protein
MKKYPVVVDAEISVTEAAHKMIQTGQKLMIVLDNNNIKGIIDSCKILRYTYAEGFRPSQTPVGEIANKEIVLARSNTTLEDALSLMVELKQETLPVVDAKPVGSINIYDLLNFQLKTKPNIAPSIA